MRRAVLSTLGFLAVATFGLAAAAPAAAVPKNGDPAPPFTLPAAAGGTIASSSFAGHPLYLNFFATWCGPCRVETPSIVALSRTYAARGLRVVGIDVGESAAKAQRFAAEFKLPYPLALDQNGALRASYGAGLFFPLHVFVDGRGVVRTYHPGEMSAAQIDAALREIVR